MSNKTQAKQTNDNAPKVALIGAIATIAVAIITGFFGLLAQQPSHTPKPPETLQTLSYMRTLSLTQASTFDETDEGWSLSHGTLTVSNGFLEAAPKTEGLTSYYIAPPSYHGDWRGYSELRLDLSSSGGNYYKDDQDDYLVRGDIFLANGRMTAKYYLLHRPSEDWETFSVPLRDNGNWAFRGGAMSLNDVLANVTDFRIRAEYGIDSDSSGLDNVMRVK